MGAAEPELSRRVCPEPVGNGGTCGRVHYAAVCVTCPDHMKAAADAFWATMGLTTPDTQPKPIEAAPAPPRRRRPGKRQRRQH